MMKFHRRRRIWTIKRADFFHPSRQQSSACLVLDFHISARVHNGRKHKLLYSAEILCYQHPISHAPRLTEQFDIYLKPNVYCAPTERPTTLISDITERVPKSQQNEKSASCNYPTVCKTQSLYILDVEQCGRVCVRDALDFDFSFSEQWHAA